MKKIISLIKTGFSEKALELLKLDDHNLSLKQASYLLNVLLNLDEYAILEWLVNDSIYRFDFNLINLLERACVLGAKKIVKVLVSLDNIKSYIDHASLYACAYMCTDLESLNVLLFDSKLSCVNGTYSFLDLKPLLGTPEHFKRMIQNNKINPSVKNELLVNACLHEDKARVKILLDDSTIYFNENNDYALQKAIDKNNIDIIKMLLLDKRIDPTIRFFNTVNRAIQKNLVNVVKILLTDDRIKPSYWIDTGLSIAIDHGYEEIVRLLLNLSFADPYVYGNMALERAIDKDCINIINMLLNRGVDIATIKSNPFEFAVIKNRHQCLNILLNDSRPELSPKIHKALIAAISYYNVPMIRKLVIDKRIDSFLLNNEIIIYKFKSFNGYSYSYYSKNEKSNFSEIDNIMRNIGCTLIRKDDHIQIKTIKNN